MTAGDHAAGLKSEKSDPIRQAMRRAPALHRVIQIGIGYIDQLTHASA
jgi:hypothetical protein